MRPGRFARKRAPRFAGRPRSKPPVGARLRANAEGSGGSQQVRPQADSYSGRPMRARRHFIAPCRSALARERGVRRTISKGSPASGLLRRVWPDGATDSPVGAPLGANITMRPGRFARKRAPTAGLARRRDKFARRSALAREHYDAPWKVRPQAGSYGGFGQTARQIRP
jgi:hypothetical protein